MIKKYFLILFSILLICSIYFLLDNEGYTKKKVKDGILVSFSTDKKVYQQDEEFIVTYEIKNISPVTKTIGFWYDSPFLYSLLRIKLDNNSEYYDITKLERYASDGVVGRNTFTFKPGDVIKVSYKYSPKGNIENRKEDNITFSSAFKESTLRVHVSFPIFFQK